jgi:hypothetical protein
MYIDHQTAFNSSGEYTKLKNICTYIPDAFCVRTRRIGELT